MDVLERLGDLLREAGFGGRPSIDLLAEGGGAVPPVGALRTLGRGDDTRIAALLALFCYGQAVDRSDAEQALAPLALDDVLGAGLVAADGAQVRSPLRVSDFQGLILAGDPPRDVERREHVMALSTASTHTAFLTVRRAVATALDLGTGSGIHALLAARHAEDVLGVDINAHALSLARMNARLNRLEARITWLEGSWLEALPGRRFDLVVANPPYVVSPDSALVYRDGDVPGDEVSREVVRGAADALADGGFATVMCSWIHSDGAWDAPLRDWVAGRGCDALLLHHASQAGLAYAMAWNRWLVDSDPAAFAATVERWVSHYERIGAERIATGFVILRRRSGGANWCRAFANVGIPRGDGGDQLERMFRGGDLLAEAGGLGDLLARPWRLLDGHRLDQQTVYLDGLRVGTGRMSCRPDMGVQATVDPRVLAVVLGCDGERSLGELIAEAAIPADIDRAGFHTLCLATARDLIARGYLL